MIDELNALQTLTEPADGADDLQRNPWAMLPVNYPSLLDEVSPDVAERAILLTLAQVHREQPDGEADLDHIPQGYLTTLHANIYRVLGVRRSMDEVVRLPVPKISRLWRPAPEFIQFASTPG
jgi:hypothetical protein